MDWFTEHAGHYANVLSGRGLERKAGARALFVGPFEGVCVQWTFRNVLTGPAASAVVVPHPRDPEVACLRASTSRQGGDAGFWHSGTPRALDRALGELVRERPDRRFELMRMRKDATQANALVELRARNKGAPFDFVFIDAQSSKHAMEMATLAFPMLAKLGVMAITNYTHGRTHDAGCPRRGIDGFLDAYATELKVLRSAFHVFIERRAEPFVLSCASEYFDGSEKPPVCPEPFLSPGRPGAADVSGSPGSKSLTKSI